MIYSNIRTKCTFIQIANIRDGRHRNPHCPCDYTDSGSPGSRKHVRLHYTLSSHFVGISIEESRKLSVLLAFSQNIAASNMILLYEDIRNGSLAGLLQQVTLDLVAIVPLIKLEYGHLSVWVLSLEKLLSLLRIRAPTFRENNNVAFSYGGLDDFFGSRHWFEGNEKDERYEKSDGSCRVKTGGFIYGDCRPRGTN